MKAAFFEAFEGQRINKKIAWMDEGGIQPGED